MNVLKYYTWDEWNALPDDERRRIREETDAKEYAVQRDLFQALKEEVLDTVIKIFDYYMQPYTYDGTMNEPGMIRVDDLTKRVDIVFETSKWGGGGYYEQQALKALILAVVREHRDLFYYNVSLEIVVAIKRPEKRSELEEGDRDVSN